MNDGDELTPRERHALAQWRGAAPPDDFPARVLARLESERPAPRVRQVAVAALAVVLLGGLFLFRLMSSGDSTYGAAHALGDGGSSLEVNPIADGVRS